MNKNRNISVWLIIPQTNLHVGNEGVGTFSVIDKAIQRDVTTTLPCINSSSLKGAVKELLTAWVVQKKSGVSAEMVKRLFGSIKENIETGVQKEKNTQKEKDTQKGLATFFDATLLYLPVQSDEHLYDLTFADELLNLFVEKVKNLGREGFDKKAICECILYPHKRAVATEEFIESCNDESLPIIARNCLDNGESVNLWYEQVLPSMSVLATVIETPEDETLDMLDGQIVQIGANATIGYGFCKFVKIK